MPTSARLLRDLIPLRTQFDAASLSEKENILKQLLKEKNFSANTLLQLHEVLLFLLAHPHDPAFAARAARLLEQTAGGIRKHIKKTKKEGVFENSGTSGTQVNACFSFELLQWLIVTYPGGVKLNAIHCESSLQYATLSPLLPAPLREHFNEGPHESVESWLAIVAGPGRYEQLKFIVKLFENAHSTVAIRNQLFDQLELYVSCDLNLLPSRSQIRGRKGKAYFHTEALLKKIDLPSLIASPLDAPVHLKDLEKENVISSMRLQLLCLYRETDPVTYADPRDLTIFNVGRGMDIALIGMDAEHRNPVDAYIGFMAFKNGLPYAYGGAWLLGKMAKIGINIFPSYRGGESAWFFAQLMRVYYQQFKPSYFVAEPYQVGRENPEGIETGAFWFYYKLGFRPIQKKLQQLASAEIKKLINGSSKKTPAKILERLVQDEIVYLIPGNGDALQKKYDTEQLSAALISPILKRYQGDLHAFEEASKTMLLEDAVLSKLFPRNKNSLHLQKLSLYLLAAGNFADWTPEEKTAVGKLLLEKTSGTDSDYARLFAQHEKLNRTLFSLAHNKQKGK